MDKPSSNTDMKVLTLFAGLTLTVSALNAQNGYIRLSSDSLLTGYIKTVYDFNDNQRVLEFWSASHSR